MLSIQQKVNAVFTEAFGRTPLKHRIDDIFREAVELNRFIDIQHLKEETGDVLCSILALCAENGWDAETLISDTLEKIERRKKQYQSFGRKISVAVYGGSFDPIHNSHVQVAKLLLDTSSIFDEVWILPCNNSMYGKKLSSGSDRLRMCELATKKDPRIKVCDWEIKNNMSGETFKIIQSMKECPEYKDVYDFSFIMGMDNALKAHTWYNWEVLERYVRFVIIPREGYSISSDVTWFFKHPHVFINKESPIPGISSSEFKMLFSSVQFEAEKLVDPQVWRYILDNNLYKG